MSELWYFIFYFTLTEHMSMGGLGDSFYEYLLKSWIQSGKTDVQGREMFDEAMKAVLKHMLQTSPGGLLYISDLKYDKLEQKMDALACFAGEVLVLEGIRWSGERLWTFEYFVVNFY